MRRSLVLLVVSVLFGALLMTQGNTLVSLAQNATPEAGSAVVISSEVFGRAVPVAVEDPELALARVTIMPGATLPTHYHPGTQIGVVVQGVLTYEVISGEIAWFRADHPDGEPAKIRPGDTVAVGVGDTLVETPGSIHQGRNEGAVPLVIYLSTLFPADEPRAIIVEATPVP